jgi:hypothetical protein
MTAPNLSPEQVRECLHAAAERIRARGPCLRVPPWTEPRRHWLDELEDRRDQEHDDDGDDEGER